MGSIQALSVASKLVAIIRAGECSSFSCAYCPPYIGPLFSQGSVDKSMSGRRQNSTSVTKRRKVRGRESGSSSNGELSNADRTQRQQQQQQQQQQRQQLQQRQTVSPPTVAPLPVVNPASSRPTAVSVPWRPMDDGGDQVSPASPITSRRITKANLHISEQMPESLDPTIHHQVISLPKEAFRLNNTDFICYLLRKQQQAEKLDTRELPTKSKDEVLELLRNFSRNDKESVCASLVQMMESDEAQRKKAERETSISFFTDLKQRKLKDIESLKRQIDVITKDIDTLMKDLLRAEKTVLGAELCSSSVSSLLPLDELPGPSGLQLTQSTESTHSISSDVQKTMYLNLQWTIKSYFEEIADNYIQARVPVLSGVQSSLEEWEKSLNELTQLKKFRELGTLMYRETPHKAQALCPALTLIRTKSSLQWGESRGN